MPSTFSYRRERLAPADCPVAPIIDVILRHNNKSRSYAALIDTGSPVSTINAKALLFLQPEKRGSQRFLTAKDAIVNEPSCDFYRLDEVHFAGTVYRNHPLFLMTQRDEEMIIGRDILQFHSALFDGPSEELLIG